MHREKDLAPRRHDATQDQIKQVPRRGVVAAWREVSKKLASLGAVVAAFGTLTTNRVVANEGNLVKADVQQQLRAIEATIGGRLGLAALHLESGMRVSFNDQQTFALASVRKLPLAMTALARVDQGTEQLDRSIRVQADDVLPSGGTPPAAAVRAGSIVTVRRLLELMMLYSDNTAMAVIQRVTATASATQARLGELGIAGVRITKGSPQLLQEVGAIQRLKGRQRSDALARWEDDPSDAATPTAMVDLLRLLQNGHALSPESTAFLLELMQRCETGPRRLRAGLPAGATLSHKTGTLARTTNDVGIATLADGSHVAIAIFITGAKQSTPACEDILAATARLAFSTVTGPTP